MFVTFEGGEGAGKSTLIKAVADHVQSLDAFTGVTLTREPGGSSFGPDIRRILLDRGYAELDPRAEALLFAADRAQHVREIIRPALEDGHLVLCDRYIDSSAAYQGIARGIAPAEIVHLSAWGTADLRPDITLVIDIPVDIGLARKHAQRETNRIEDLGNDFHQLVRDAFLAIAAAEPNRCYVLNGDQPVDYLVADALGIILARKASQANRVAQE